MNAITIALGLEYNGAAFRGWQRQHPAPDHATVQGELEIALSEIAQSPIAVTAAGRTDAGVHASLQIVHFESSVMRPLSAWVRGTNAHLPSTVAVRWAVEVASSFHARFSAVSRRYSYWLLNRPTRPALLSAHVGWFHLPLDEGAMHDAAQQLVGEHDFSSFRSSECQAKTPVKTLHAIAVTRHGDYLRFDVHANAFLHHMVRNMVGALVYVGAQKIPTAQLLTLLNARDRTLAPPTFSPEGLYLTGIEYPPEFALPESFVEPLP